MQTSDRGIEALKLEEGAPLRAYRDVVGVWTIYAGLTAASGVVVPKAGMVITEAEGQALLRRALRDNYEPAVAMSMTHVAGSAVIRPLQHEFDAGVSFHFNTGAIKRATWVKRWKAKAARADVRASLLQWNKGGGRVLPGLAARREREAAMLQDAQYRGLPLTRTSSEQQTVYAGWGIALSSIEKAAVGKALADLGYNPGPSLDAVLRPAVTEFQRRHGLTVDGIIGRATLSTLQRELDARAKVKVPAAATAVSVPAASTGVADQIASLPHVGTVLVVGSILWALLLAYRYRDVIAAKIHNTLPRVAAAFRSF